MAGSESVVRRFYEALGHGDAETAFGLLDPGVKWLETERSPYFQGEIEGVDAIIETVFGPIGADFENFTAVPRDYLTGGDRTAAIGRYGGIANATGRKLQADFVHVWTVREGRLVRFEQHTDTAGWKEALGGQ